MIIKTIKKNAKTIRQRQREKLTKYGRKMIKGREGGVD